MRKSLYSLVFVLALSLACASAQTGNSNSGGSQTQSQQAAPKDPTRPSSTGALGSNPTPPDQPNVQGANTVSTADLQVQIQNALKNEPTLANENINVSVTDNEIELSGTVANGKAKLTAKRIAQSYAGNRKVKEHLTVSGGQDNVSNPVHNNENPASNPDSNSKPAGNKPPQE